MKNPHQNPELLLQEIESLRLQLRNAQDAEQRQKQAIQHLQKENEMLDNAKRLVRLGIWEWDPFEDCLIWSDEMYHLFGVTPENFEVTYENYLEFVHPEDLHIVDASSHVDLSMDEPSCIEYRIIRPDGKMIMIEEHIEIQLNNHHEVIHMTGTSMDITHRQSALQAHQESEERFKKLADATFEAVLIHDNFNILEANHSASHLLGYPLDELIGLEAVRVIAPQSRQLVQKMAQSGYEKPFEARIERKDQMILPVEIHGKSISYKSQKVRVTVIRDITKQKQAEEELKQSAEQLRQVIDLVPHQIYAKDEEGKFVLANQTTAHNYGVTVEKLLNTGQTDYHFTKEDLEDSLQTDAEIIATGRSVFTPVERTYDYKGNLHYLQTSKIPFFSYGTNKKAVLGVSINITEEILTLEKLRRSEEQFRQFFELGVVGMAITRGDRKWEIVNRRLCEILGYTSAELTSMTWNEVTHLDDVQVGENQIQKIFEGKLDGYSAEKRYLHKQGKTVHTSVDVRCIRKEDGSVSHFLALIFDITERKRAEEEIQQLNQDLEYRVVARTEELELSLHNLKEAQDKLIKQEKMASLGVLTAGVAHEINTPIGIGITAASHLEYKSKQFFKLYQEKKIKRADLNKYIEDALEASSAILRNLNRAADLIRGFKQVAVDQSSEISRRFQLKVYIDQVLLTLQPKLKQTKHKVIVNCSEEIELDSYPGIFSQIITNLIMNSLVHGFEEMQEGTILIDISLHEKDLFFLYVDDGKGMGVETTKKIFDPFYTTKRNQGGTGLGGTILYNLVETLGGHIECISQQGEGTTFKIFLPQENLLAPSREKVNLVG